MERIRHALLRKLPELAEAVRDTAVLPWPGMLFLRIRPTIFSVLDYIFRARL
jgi:hypothetical protein